MTRSIFRRLIVVGPGMIAGAVVSGLFATVAASKLSWGFADTFLVWASVMSGPLSGLWAAPTCTTLDAVGWTAAIGMGILAHPIRPGILTGLVSAAGLGLWLLMGFALTFDGV